MNFWKIHLLENQNIYFFSDPHYNHKNICRGVTDWKSIRKVRDFDNLEDMNNKIVENINNLVKETDYLVCLGDWAFGGHKNIEIFRKRINCKNIYLIFGNHDDHIDKNTNNYRDLFTACESQKILKVSRIEQGRKKNYIFHLNHFPLASWRDMKDGIIHLFGHLHSQAHVKVMKGKSMDIGMDGNNLHPYSLDDLLSILKTKKILNNVIRKDHHIRKKGLGSIHGYLRSRIMHFFGRKP